MVSSQFEGTGIDVAGFPLAFVYDVPDWQILPIPGAVTVPSLAGTGTTYAGTVTASSAPIGTNAQTRTPHVKYLVTVAATTAIASVRQNATAHNPSSGGLGGYKVHLCTGPATGVATTGGTSRFFLGLRSSASAPTDVEPSTLVDIIGMGYDSADTNVQIMHNDNTGTATKIDTGWAVPTADSTDMYQIEICSHPTETSVDYLATNLATGATVTGTLSTNLPSSTKFMAFQSYHSVGGTSSVVGIAIGPNRGHYQLK